jgi:hypothetical protein
MGQSRRSKLLIASEFQGLDDLHGFLKYGNLILKLKLPIMPKRQPAIPFVPRVGVPLVKKPLPDLDTIREERKKAAEEKRAAQAEERNAKAALAAALDSFLASRPAQPAEPPATGENPPQATPPEPAAEPSVKPLFSQPLKSE